MREGAAEEETKGEDVAGRSLEERKNADNMTGRSTHKGRWNTHFFSVAGSGMAELKENEMPNEREWIVEG